MTDSEQAVRIERHENIGIIELARPAKFNCLNRAVADGIAAALDQFEAAGDVRAILIRAQGKHFCTGADLDEVMGLRKDKAAFGAFIARGHEVLDRLEASGFPVIAAVQGLCLAGGLELMMAADVAFAAEGARFGDQHAEYGLVPGWGSSQRLPRLIGLRRAMDLFYSHRWIDAETALDWGLVNNSPADEALDDAARAYCPPLTQKPRPGLAAMKRLARDGIDMSLTDGLALERDLAVDCLTGPEADEGLAAFRERRKPNFV